MKLINLDQTDKDLCARYQCNADNQVIGELFRRYYKTVLKWHIAWNHQHYGGRLDISILEDLTSNVFAIHLEKSLKRAGPIQNFRAWLNKMAHDRWVDYLRKQKKIIEIDDFFEEEDDDFTVFHHIFSCRDFDFDKPEGLSWREINTLLLRWKLNIIDFLATNIKVLKPHQSQCLKMYYLQKYSYREIVESTDFSQKQVKSYLQNGRKNLQKQVTIELKRICYEKTNHFL